MCTPGSQGICKRLHADCLQASQQCIDWYADLTNHQHLLTKPALGRHETGCESMQPLLPSGLYTVARKCKPQSCHFRSLHHAYFNTTDSKCIAAISTARTDRKCGLSLASKCCFAACGGQSWAAGCRSVCFQPAPLPLPLLSRLPWQLPPATTVSAAISCASRLSCLFCQCLHHSSAGYASWLPLLFPI